MVNFSSTLNEKDEMEMGRPSADVPGWVKLGSFTTPLHLR